VDRVRGAGRWYVDEIEDEAVREWKRRPDNPCTEESRVDVYL
jgi:hypothetical protein